MAREMKVVLTDDIDGSEAAETVRFGIDQGTYEIELSSENAEKLRAALAPYISKGRRVAASSRPARARRSTPSAGSNNVNAKIREWAKENGIEVSERGRIAQSVIDAYHQAHA
ncbi:histone-like nucleoid-structuring protein Lsr2 [Brevibacterium album]|uniref:histone-like nucleoid-structuring protein Lsr2 n=1 Tax=Brevibacterium album TaxID=417948 RepID=UPI00041A13F5|nr:Lsr2 family protein [Brevibacterium album]